MHKSATGGWDSEGWVSEEGTTEHEGHVVGLVDDDTVWGATFAFGSLSIWLALAGLLAATL
jgi:hypothetical protein